MPPLVAIAQVALLKRLHTSTPPSQPPGAVHHRWPASSPESPDGMATDRRRGSWSPPDDAVAWVRRVNHGGHGIAIRRQRRMRAPVAEDDLGIMPRMECSSAPRGLSPRPHLWLLGPSLLARMRRPLRHPPPASHPPSYSRPPQHGAPAGVPRRRPRLRPRPAASSLGCRSESPRWRACSEAAPAR